MGGIVNKRWLESLLRTGLAPGIFIMIWFFLTENQIVDKLFIPCPTTVFKTAKDLLMDSQFWINMGNTLWRMMAGFFLAAIAAIPIGITLGSMNHLYAYSEFLLDFTRSIPATALYPLFLLSLGIGDKSKIAIVVFACFFVILINSIYGVWNAPKTRVVMAQTFRASRLQIFSKIILLDALPEIFAGLRNALSIALIMTVVAEMFIGTNSGLGFLIMNAKMAYNTAAMYAVIIILGALGYISSRLLLGIEKKIIHWSRI
jgi:ABC-type nitrate/sulfonate/bicarbonate transport system permease component